MERALSTVFIDTMPVVVIVIENRSGKAFNEPLYVPYTAESRMSYVCVSCVGASPQCRGSWPAGSLGARACAADASVGAKGARCARPELETGSDPITQMECLAGDGW